MQPEQTFGCTGCLVMCGNCVSLIGCEHKRNLFLMMENHPCETFPWSICSAWWLQNTFFSTMWSSFGFPFGLCVGDAIAKSHSHLSSKGSSTDSVPFTVWINPWTLTSRGNRSCKESSICSNSWLGAVCSKKKQ